MYIEDMILVKIQIYCLVILKLENFIIIEKELLLTPSISTMCTAQSGQ